MAGKTSKANGKEEGASGFWARFMVMAVVVLWVSLVAGNWLGQKIMASNKTFAVTNEEYRNLPDERSRLRGRPPTMLESGEVAPAAPVKPPAPKPVATAPQPEETKPSPGDTPTEPRVRFAPVPTPAVAAPTETPEEKQTETPTLINTPPQQVDRAGNPMGGETPPPPENSPSMSAPAPPVPTPERSSQAPPASQSEPAPPRPTPASPGAEGQDQ